MKKKLKDIAEIKFCILEKGNEEKYLLTPANLLEDNQISKIEKDEKFKRDESVILKKGDIILKRINPTYVNYIDKDYANVYVGNNLIIIRAKEIDSKYLAAILNANIRKYSERNSVGSIIPSIGRKDIEEMKIIVCERRKQEIIGNYWIKTIEKRILERKIIELEKKKNMLIINKILNVNGGNVND